LLLARGNDGHQIIATDEAAQSWLPLIETFVSVHSAVRQTRTASAR
jgi:hypothetical protein